MSETTGPACPTLARTRDDMMLGSSEQDYILRIEPTPADVKADEDRAAALTVCGRLGTVYPDLTHPQVISTARLILGQLGLLDVLFVAARDQRTAQAS